MHRSSSLVLLLGLAACTTETVDPEPFESEETLEAELATCADLPEPAGWEHTRSEAIVHLGGPVHSVQDDVITPGADWAVRAKLSYGPTSADLEDEAVEAWIRLGDECDDWTLVGTGNTDDDGRVRIPGTFDLEVGAYPVTARVLGDGSQAHGMIHVLPEGQALVVFDIDGTLTTSDLELVGGVVYHHVGTTSDEVLNLAGSPLTQAQWLALLDATIDPEAAMYEAADEVAWWYADRGFQPVYITGRPYLYDGFTREWLADRAFPAGPLFLVQDVVEVVPAYVDDYKERTMNTLQDRSFGIEHAYGNASTDVCAYARAGVDPAETYIIGDNGGTACEGYDPTQAIASYPEHLVELGD
ncbi:MAG: hypothetical protein CMN30_10720 [Sandaracinus sp.]|nr:hypothetical protein [Sandaracinus sp.]